MQRIDVIPVRVKDLKSSLDRIQDMLEVLTKKLDSVESPNDGKFYVRSHGGWGEITGATIIKNFAALTVTISSTENNISLVSGTTKTINLSATVKGTWSNGIEETLDDGYTLEWSNYNNNGITFFDGVLTITDATSAGTYNIPLTATVKYGKNTSTGNITINASVTAPAPTLTGRTISKGVGDTINETVESTNTTVGEKGVTSATWNSTNIPTGLTFNNGKYTGTASAAFNKTSNVSVTTNAGSANCNIIWKIAKTYEIRKNGSKLTSVSMADFVAKCKDGSALTDWGYGSQIIIPYTDPVNNTEYECPFNFGTHQTFTKKDNSTFLGLGLVAEYGLPIGNIQFDNKEPSNSDSNRQKYGNNRWMYSNLRQWLNKSGKNWYTKQHSADAAPTTPNPANVTGFLDCLPSEFVDACIPVKNSTKTHSVDGGGYDTTYDKFFPLSMSQANMKCTDTSLATGDESEGRYWEYWRTKQGGSGYWSGNTSNNGGLVANSARKIYNIENHASACYWWLRSAILHTAYSYSVWRVYTSGIASYYHAHDTNFRVAPACVIS